MCIGVLAHLRVTRANIPTEYALSYVSFAQAGRQEKRPPRQNGTPGAPDRVTRLSSLPR